MGAQMDQEGWSGRRDKLEGIGVMVKGRRVDFSRGDGGGGALRSFFWRVVALGFVLAVCAMGQTEASIMDVTAFEYFRKFGKHLELGECPNRELPIILPNSTRLVRKEICMARQKGIVTHVPRVISDVRHVLMPSAADLVVYLGLCGAEAASYLGLLNDGDCIVVDIGSRLTFSKKTMVRAYFVYYHQSVDILDGDAYPWDHNATSSRVREDMKEFLENKFYVKNRSYGTLELILVQFRFRSSKETEAAQKLQMNSDSLMSEYMKRLEREVGKPNKVLVLTLSTGTEEKYRIERYSSKQWGSAVRDVEIREGIVNVTRQRIQSGHIRPHLNYQLFPFVAEEGQSSRTNTMALRGWEDITMMEVSLRSSISTANKSSKQCQKKKTKLCRRVRELRRKLVALKEELHTARASWSVYTPEESQALVQHFSRRVAMHTRMAASLAGQVRKTMKEEKLKETRKKKKEPNEVPVNGRIGKVELEQLEQLEQQQQQKHRDWLYHQRIKQRWPQTGQIVHRG